MSSVEAPFKYLVRMLQDGEQSETGHGVPQCGEMPLHERMFHQLNDLYTDTKNGLIVIGEKIGKEIFPPKKKITILLIGNHSAGKSSFINWYIEDNVQRTGMAIETQSFSVVASGRKRETLMGPATLFLFPHLKPLEKMEGVLDYLCTEISTSKKRQFSMITFIDTPGLVDGGMEYPYNVDDAILFLGGIADLVFIFFDPIGLALCKRTMKAVERINSCYPEKIHFYLSKSDEIRKQTDKQKIMMQITQEVCRHSGLNRSGFTMPGIYIPSLSLTQKPTLSSSANTPSTCQTGECFNEIDEVSKQIDQTISRTLQIALNNFDRDISIILETIKDQLITNRLISDKNWKLWLSLLVVTTALSGVMLSAGTQYVAEQFGLDYLSTMVHISPNTLQSITVPGRLITKLSDANNKMYLHLGYAVVALAFTYLCYCKMSFKSTLPRRDVKELERLKQFVGSYLFKKKVELTQEYLRDSYEI